MQAQEPVTNKRQKKELKGKLEQMVSPRCARTDAIMKTQCGGWHKIKPINALVWDGKGFVTAHPFLGSSFYPSFSSGS